MTFSHTPHSVLCLLLLAAGGCGSKGTVCGNVTYQGKPIVSGSVSVIASDNIQYAVAIAPDGTYAIPKVPRGPVKFCVASPNPGSVTRGGRAYSMDDRANIDAGSPVASDWFPIPEKYADPIRSGLLGNVRSATLIDLDLQ